MLGIKQQETAKAYDIGAKFNERTLETFLRQVISMLSIAVCDDEILECCRLAQMIKDILDAMGLPYLLRQFGSGKELLQAAGSFGRFGWDGDGTQAAGKIAGRHLDFSFFQQGLCMGCLRRRGLPLFIEAPQ